MIAEAVMNRTEVLHTEGRWRITRYTWHDGSYMAVGHFCIAERGENPTPGWAPMYYSHTQLWEPCYVCHSRVPDGLQGAFIMLDWDR